MTSRDNIVPTGEKLLLKIRIASSATSLVTPTSVSLVPSLQWIN
jgi:hypothetical protein